MPSGLEPATILLSYDVPRDMRTIAARVSHLIFGRSDAGTEAPLPYIGRPGVVWIGQSVFVMPRSTAQELAAKLEALGAHVALACVSIERSELEAFRRGNRRRAP